TGGGDLVARTRAHFPTGRPDVRGERALPRGRTRDQDAADLGTLARADDVFHYRPQLAARDRRRRAFRVIDGRQCNALPRPASQHRAEDLHPAPRYRDRARSRTADDPVAGKTEQPLLRALTRSPLVPATGAAGIVGTVPAGSGLDVTHLCGC